jgi:hypothetical protein
MAYKNTAAKAMRKAVSASVPLSADATGRARMAVDYLRPTQLDRRYTFEEFEVRPVCAAASGAAASGTTSATNVMLFPETAFEYHIKGAGQTIVAPVLTANGLDIGLDQASTEGVEITQGITARSPGAFVVGTDAAFFFSCKIKVEDASGCNPLVAGFRKAEAYQTTVAAYADYAAIGIIGTANPNTIKTTTEAAGGGNTDTDTTNTWADAAAKTLTVKVSAAGVVTYQINGVAPTTVVAFSFTAGDVLVPFVFFLNAADLAGTVELQEWTCGLQ